MRFRLVRFINLYLLICLILLTLTGVWGLFWTFVPWVFDLHRWAGWALLVALPWKAIIVIRSLRRRLRPDFDRGVMILLSLVLAALTLLVLALGLGWNWRFGPQDLPLRQTAISWHWMLALGLLLPLALHTWRRWPRPSLADFRSRRAALKLLVLGATSLLGWLVAERLADRRARSQQTLRFTGSRLDGYFSGNRFPVTQSLWLDQSRLDLASYRLSLDGEVEFPLSWSYPDLLAQTSSALVATLDCTLGWYSTQTWRGLPLADLLAAARPAPGVLGVRFESLTGYAHTLPMEEALQVLLATHVGGETLEHAHGFPLRAVVPTRRGWFWVKWLTHIEVFALPNRQRG